MCAPCPPRRVFVTSNAFSGNLGGISGADDLCQAEADDANLSGTYLAWVSNSPPPGSDGLSPATNPNWNHSSCQKFYLIDGITLIADNWADLTDGTIAHIIDQNAVGDPVTNVFVWTNTQFNGTAFSLNNSCPAEWTDGTAESTAYLGANVFNDSQWAIFVQGACNTVGVRLYCFEQ